MEANLNYLPNFIFVRVSFLIHKSVFYDFKIFTKKRFIEEYPSSFWTISNQGIYYGPDNVYLEMQSISYDQIKKIEDKLREIDQKTINIQEILEKEFNNNAKLIHFLH